MGKRANTELAGTYACNVSGNSCQCELDVQEHIVISTHLEKAKVTEGEDFLFTIECNKPNFTCRWYAGETEIVDSALCDLSQEGKVAKCFLKSIALGLTGKIIK